MTRLTDQTLEVLERYDFNEQARNALEPLKGKYFKDEKTFEKAVEGVEDHDGTRVFSGPFNLANMVTLKEYSTTSYDFTPYLQGLKYSKIRQLWNDLKRHSRFDDRVTAISAFNEGNRWRKRGVSMIPLKYGVSYSGPRGILDQGGLT